MHSKAPLVSVIVPIYNTEKYLSNCIESILDQTYKKVEVILVDDGSTDRSLKNCEELAREDGRIEIIQGNHQGLVSARKRGVEGARGEYCIFVDSDDWIDRHLIEAAMSRTEGGTVDIVTYNLQSMADSDLRIWKYTIPEGIYEKEALKNIYMRMMFDFHHGYPGIIQSLCTKLVRRELLWKCLRNVDERITLGEDAAVTYHMILEAERIAVLHQPLYFYRIRSESMCHVPDSEMFSKLSLFYQYMQKILEDYSRDYGLETQLRAYLLNYIVKGLRDIFSINLRGQYRIPDSLLADTDKKLVLYGAGKVGKSYYKHLLEVNDIDLVAWIDKGKADQKIYGCRIGSAADLNKIVFDKIIIAIQDEKIAKEITMELKEFVSKERILWEEPLMSWWEKEIEI